MLGRKSRQARNGDAPFASRKKDVSRANESREYLPGLMVGSLGCACSAEVSPRRREEGRFALLAEDGEQPVADVEQQEGQQIAPRQGTGYAEHQHSEF